ncbi:ROK family protein [Spirochaeta thermophila DSM 6578]|uniref:fructokinase n=1 Tax=Winmispira thermophila (strain ATCC 700085 / DSM 6578 / Z-1203) TaxID=869211 RepID=G0GF60_WINT7|nr:ROK family protein [Spirochaeta thermophila]AEJ60759.1 ROK family protein [Spirochaeta thermophila DSM 6578]
MLGGIEAGGTKWVCALGPSPDRIAEEARFPTTTPKETIARALSFFREMEARHGRLAALGIGSFGPVDVREDSPTWGYITTTPKPGWRDTRVAGVFQEELGVPVGFDTDVNAAALGELSYGAARGLSSVVYITVGTGIGAGVVVDGRPVHGLVHPEAGHILVRRHPDDTYGGRCPFHRDCLEGMASGPALAERWSMRGEDLPQDHQAWRMEAFYLAQGVMNLVLAVSPERVILGGGVMQQGHLFPLVRSELLRLLAGYVGHPAITEQVDDYVVPPGLGQRAGIVGALVLAARAGDRGAHTR